MRAGVLVALSLVAGIAAAQHGPGDPTHRHFDKPAEQYARTFDDPRRDAWQKPAEVLKLLAIAPGMTVADLGAGTGYFVPHLARATGEGGRVLALDVEPDLVRYLGERAQKEGLPQVTARLIPRDDPGLEPGSVDRVLIVDTWHHIGGRDAYAPRLAASLAPGGRVVIVEVTPQSPHGPPKRHRLAPAQVVNELRAAGLEAQVVKERLPRQYVVVGRKPLTPPR
jgi:cyclopropane fatty-acyl-phospholipid synthase-like methyltransferase